MNPADLAMMAVMLMLVSLIVVELVKPARRFEQVKGWRLKGLGFIVMMFAIGGGLPVLFGELVPLKVLPGERLSTLGGAVAGIVTIELLMYWVHRLNHRVGFLWRWVHQMHHSAERMDIFGAGLFHPLEVIETTVVPMLIGNVLLGLSPEAAGLAGAWGAFNGIFQHGNIKTPRWLGYFIQRPEQHGVHHQRGVHAFNYANLPLIDLLFGTFKNPAVWEGEGGFYAGGSKKMLPMLIGRDVSAGQPARTRAVEASAA
jgi:sterol desaturase/sphingolipid hydroxylase (fatty acid hydroxylase superfamily)